MQPKKKTTTQIHICPIQSKAHSFALQRSGFGKILKKIFQILFTFVKKYFVIKIIF